MTKDSDFKRLVRARMARTGEPYTAARAALEQRPASTGGTAYDDARREQARLVSRLFVDGRLLRIPAKRRVRVGALLEILTRFQPGRDYVEPEVNEILREVHEDVASLRRELVTYRYLERSGGQYRVTAHAPDRSVQEAQEIPDWEACWLPAYLLGGQPSVQN